MTSNERIKTAMSLGVPDRVPVMCQLSLGHYFLYSGVDPIDIWLTSEGFAEALVSLQQRYSFDGILINLPGRPPDIKNQIKKIERINDEVVIHWENGCFTKIPKDDNPHYYQNDGSIYYPSIDVVDPEKLFYVDPWDIHGITYPYQWTSVNYFEDSANGFPDYISDTIKFVKQKAQNDISIHSELFSPWSQLLELLNYENALIAIMMDPEKVKLILERLTAGSIELAKIHAKAGVDALLISSAFAGAGFISKEHYKEFVLPYESKFIKAVKSEFDLPIYTHTCGSIGDRLDLMLETGTNGIDTLDPPPLGTIDLNEAKKYLDGKAFIKGNIDPVNIMLNGSIEEIEQDVKHRLEIGKLNGSYILSTACSIAPTTPPKNIEVLIQLAEKYGRY